MRSIIRGAILRVRSGGIRGLVQRLIALIHGYIQRYGLQYIPSIMVPSIHWYTDLRSTSHYTDADPFKIVWIDPDRIQYLVGPELPIVWGKVRDGDWHNNKQLFKQYDAYKAVCRYLDTGNSALLYNYFKNQYAPWSGLSSDDFDDWITRFDAMAVSMQKDGYKTQMQLLQEENSWSNEPMAPWLDDIITYLGPEGEFLWVMNGTHRLIVAKYFGLNKIAVRIAQRHADWQDVRDRIRSAESIADLNASDRALLDHPDLQNLRSDLSTASSE